MASNFSGNSSSHYSISTMETETPLSEPNTTALHNITAPMSIFDNDDTIQMNVVESDDNHFTFMLGVLMLVSTAVLCTMFLARLTKSKFGGAPYTTNIQQPNFMTFPRCNGAILWLPSANKRESQELGRKQSAAGNAFLLLRSSFRCNQRRREEKQWQTGKSARQRSIVGDAETEMPQSWSTISWTSSSLPNSKSSSGLSRTTTATLIEQLPRYYLHHNLTLPPPPAYDELT